VAVSCVALTYVVGNVDFTLLGLVHCTVEQGKKPVPVTVNVTAELPATAEVCDSVVTCGVVSPVVGLDSVNGSEFEVPIEFVTVTPIDPANAASATEIVVVSCVALTKVVGRASPFQLTTESLVKFVPFTVNVKPWALHAGVDAAEVVDAEIDVIAGGVPGVAPMVKSTTFDISVVVVLFTLDVGEEAEPGICTATLIVPAVVRSEAGTGAVN
jgi:hypothetical protein